MSDSTLPHRDNVIHSLTVTQLQQVDKLTVLLLKGNPLHSVWEGASEPGGIHFPTLQTVEMSMANTSHLQASDLTPFSGLTVLHLSCDGDLHVQGSLHTPGLRLLDIRDCSVEDFSPDLMQNLEELQAVHGMSYKLCCPQTLPEGDNNWQLPSLLLDH